MYLCLGVFMTLLSKEVFGKPNYATQENIFETIHNRFGNFEYALPSPTTISKYFSCTREINDIVINEIKRLKTTDSSLLFDNLKAIAIDLQNNIISAFKQKDLVSVIIYIIEHDDEISASTVIGKSGYYTRNELLHAKEIDLTEFLENILYFIFDERKNNDSRGNQTTKWIHEKKDFTDIVSHSTINLITYNPDNKQTATLSPDNSSNNVMSKTYPRKLTDYTVIGATPKNVLFRDSEYADIINTMHSEVNSILLHGMGGCGKTSLARLIYCTTKDDYDCFGWINYSKNLKYSLMSSMKSLITTDRSNDENNPQKKWQEIENLLTNRNISKLIVIDNIDFIDGIQNPIEDTYLFDISSWSNSKVIATSRLSNIDGFDEFFEVPNLGNSKDYKNCIDLFYYYNSKAQSKRNENEAYVSELCRMSNYNTLMIELLAKSSFYHYSNLKEFVLKLQNTGFYCIDDVPIFTAHTHTAIGTSSHITFQEPLSEQLIKLFNLNNRTNLEQQILWELSCLPANEKISATELKDWFGYGLSNVDQLVREGWISFEDTWFNVHPLIRDSVMCYYNSQENIRNLYWERGIKLRESMGNNDNIIISLLNNDFSLLSKDIHHKLCNIVHALTDGGNVLSNNVLFNLGYYYYTANITYFSSYYINKLYIRIITGINNNTLSLDNLSVSVLAIKTMCVYYLLYISDNLESMIDSPITKDILFNAIFNMTTYLDNKAISTEIKPVISKMYYCLGNYILNTSNANILEETCNYLINNVNNSQFYINNKLSYSLPSTISYKNQMAICYSFLHFAERYIKETITTSTFHNEILLQDYAMILFNLGIFFNKLNLSLLIKDDDVFDNTIFEFGYNEFHTTLTWDDIYNAYNYSIHYIKLAIFYQSKYIYTLFPAIADTSLSQLRDMYISYNSLINILSETSQPNNTFIDLVRFWPISDVKYNILELARVSNIYADFLFNTKGTKEELILYYSLAQRCLTYIMKSSTEKDYIFETMHDYTEEIEKIKTKLNKITLENNIDTDIK